MRTRRMRAVGLAIVLAVLAASAVSAQAGDALFSPLEIASVHGASLSLDTSFQALLDNPTTASLQVVRANADMVTRKAETLRLNLGEGLDFRAHQVRSYVNNFGNLVWYGIIEDQDAAVIVPWSAEALKFDPINSVMLVRDGKTITGNVHFGGELYKIRPLKSGGHAIAAVDYSSLPPDHPAEYANLPTHKMPPTITAQANARRNGRAAEFEAAFDRLCDEWNRGTPDRARFELEYLLAVGTRA